MDRMEFHNQIPWIPWNSMETKESMDFMESMGSMDFMDTICVKLRVRAYDCFRFLFCYLSFDRLLNLAHSQFLTPRLWSQLQQQVLTIAEIKAQPPPLWNPEATRRIASRPGAHRLVADGTTGLARRPGAHRLLVGDAITRRPGAHRLL